MQSFKEEKQNKNRDGRIKIKISLLFPILSEKVQRVTVFSYLKDGLSLRY